MNTPRTLATLFTAAFTVFGCGDDTSPAEDATSPVDGGGTDAAAPLPDANMPSDGAVSPSDAAGGDGSTPGGSDCEFANATCWSGDAVAASCTRNEGFPATCAAANRQGTCQMQQSGNSVTIIYYMSAGGGAWQNTAGQTAQRDCELFWAGAYTAL